MEYGKYLKILLNLMQNLPFLASEISEDLDMRISLGVLLGGLGVIGLLSVPLPSKAEIISNLGTLTLAKAEVVGCTTSKCTASTGTVGGALPDNTPGPDPFRHQILFRIAVAGTVFASTQVLDSSAID